MHLSPLMRMTASCRWYGHTSTEIINRREPSGILMMSLTLSHSPRTHRRALTVTSNTLELLLIPPIFLDTQSDSAGGRWTSGSATKAPLFTPIHFFIWSPSTSDGDWASLSSLYLHNSKSQQSIYGLNLYDIISATRRFHIIVP